MLLLLHLKLLMLNLLLPLFYDNKPKELAVIPTAKKKLNSTRSLVPGGMLVNIVCRIIMSIRIDLR